MWAKVAVARRVTRVAGERSSMARRMTWARARVRLSAAAGIFAA